MEGLHFFIAVTESNRQMRHSLNDVTPHCPDEGIAATGRLARLRHFFQRVTSNRPAVRALQSTTGACNEAGRPAIRRSISSTTN